MSNIFELFEDDSTVHMFEKILFVLIWVTIFILKLTLKVRASFSILLF